MYYILDAVLKSFIIIGCLLSSPCMGKAKQDNNEPVNIIFDTDMGSDCDDVGALALLHAYANINKARIDRAVLYRVAIESGYRVNELRHLTTACFDTKKATVKLEAKFCKDRRDAEQPITMALASALAG